MKTSASSNSGTNTPAGDLLPPFPAGATLDPITQIAIIISKYHLPRYAVADSDRRKCAAEILEYLRKEDDVPA